MVSVNLNVLEDIMLISKCSHVVLAIQNVKLVTVEIQKTVSPVKLLLSKLMLLSLTYMMKELKNVTKPVLLVLTNYLMKTCV